MSVFAFIIGLTAFVMIIAKVCIDEAWREAFYAIVYIVVGCLVVFCFMYFLTEVGRFLAWYL